MTTRHESRHFIRAVAALIGVLSWAITPDGVSAAQDRSADASQCTARTETPQRLELADGRIVSVDLQSVATSLGSVMAVGRHGYVFPRTATRVTSPTLQDSIIGVHIDDRAIVTLVSNPLQTRKVFFPRVAATPDGSFHVLLVTSGNDVGLQPEPLDTASIWHATFVNGTWTAPERVATARKAFLQSESASELLEHNGSLTFLFSSVDDGPGPTQGGLVLLHWQNGVWSADTLRTRTATPFVRGLISPSSQSLVAVISQNIPRNGLSPADELYLVRFDSARREPHRIGGDGRRPVALPILATVGDTIVASWISWHAMRPETSRIEWARIDPDGRIVTGPIVDSGPATFPFEMIMAGDRYPLWLYRGDPRGNALALVAASGTTLARLGNLTMPLDNPKPKAVARTPTRFLVFTMKLAATDNEPMVASYTTTLEIRCPRPAQR